MKITPHFLKKVETIFTESGYVIRYEKGNFNPDFCLIEQKKVVVLNKYFTTDAKVSSLLNILSKVTIDNALLSAESAQFYLKLKQLELKFE